jgi:serine/threonine-protein kinase HipA
MADRCLLCYLPLAPGERDSHQRCIQTFFGVDIDARLPLSLGEIEMLAKEHILAHVTVPGVQKKLSVQFETNRGISPRLTIVGYHSAFILKPPTDEYPELPELEDATMHMAEACGISVVPHGLVRLRSGEHAYITRRIDRTRRGAKSHMEDLCQVSERLTEHKYLGSVEQVGKLIYLHSTAPGLDRVNFFTLLVFCFLTGNADMHLKNHSLLRGDAGYRLAPAYDLLPTTLLLPEDDEESALTVDGRKRHLSRAVFLRAAATLGIPAPAAEKSIDALLATLPAATDMLHRSFVSEAMAGRYATLMAERAERLR